MIFTKYIFFYYFFYLLKAILFLVPYLQLFVPCKPIRTSCLRMHQSIRRGGKIF